MKREDEMSGWPGSESADFGSDDHVEWAIRQQELRAARNAALEEAAKVADAQYGAIQRDTDDYIGKQRHSDSWDQCAVRISAAIRALKETS